MASFEEMNPGVHKTDGHCERRNLGLPDTEATPPAHHNREIVCDGGSSYNEFWDTGFAGDGDPYGISEYTAQSAHPVIPPQITPVPDSAPTHVTTVVPSQADADRVAAQAHAEMVARREGV